MANSDRESGIAAGGIAVRGVAATTSDRLDRNALDWGVVSLRDALGTLCVSHSLDTADLHSTDLSPDFLDECDLRFCAIILRIADILDFDRSRSPEPVYRYLRLELPLDRRQEMSHDEWRKHLATDGFRFPSERDEPYVLNFIAGPDSPAVEHDLRQFLHVIEAELHECAAVVGACSLRWRDLALPDRINRSNIKSRGYKYGEHRFTLDRSSVLRLFMGENLYEGRYTFVRELLQNALDASRHREFVERSQGNHSFIARPIEVDEWIDRNGYRWVRVSDEGMGMTESIISNYLLKAGSSYYTTAAFRADELRYSRGGRTFKPISRFGIGILSCFVLGDRVDVSTRRVQLGRARSPRSAYRSVMWRASTQFRYNRWHPRPCRPRRKRARLSPTAGYGRRGST